MPGGPAADTELDPARGATVHLIPAVHGRVIRLFQHEDAGYLASNERLELLPADGDTPITSYLGLTVGNRVVGRAAP